MDDDEESEQRSQGRETLDRLARLLDQPVEDFYGRKPHIPIPDETLELLQIWLKIVEPTDRKNLLDYARKLSDNKNFN